ncbi:hypothetical protein PGTUg99_004741 [Puccinia graminis f. sp. tritici]|uniref:Uncharacterized protein n=1 Tax=Puccinia graminis f. sp. tritici TaxID=56615 RepID=A0A5B0S236_PUCGR|nr:hypothetical protein PGTUg99_004741 [Puccinia graminis f. sp. tritici]
MSVPPVDLGEVRDVGAIRYQEAVLWVWTLQIPGADTNTPFEKKKSSQVQAGSDRSKLNHNSPEFDRSISIHSLQSIANLPTCPPNP